MPKQAIPFDCASRHAASRTQLEAQLQAAQEAEKLDEERRLMEEKLAEMRRQLEERTRGAGAK